MTTKTFRKWVDEQPEMVMGKGGGEHKVWIVLAPSNAMC